MPHLLTGATRGIGAAIAEALAAQGHTVGLLVRDTARGEDLAARLSQGPGRAFVIRLDLADLSSVRSAAAEILALPGPIRSLIHNAALWPRELRRVEAGGEALEESFVVNHLSPWLLDRLLADRLAADGARVVQVSAGIAILGRADPARTPSGLDFSPLRSYADTKLMNLLVGRHLAARLPQIPRTFVHPGVVDTDLGMAQGWLDRLLRPLKRLLIPPSSGARGPVRLATDPALAGLTDRWFDQEQERPWPDPFQRPDLGAILAQQADARCGLPPLG